MALSDDAKADGLPEEVIAEVEGAEQEGGDGQPQPEQRETIRLSRRKKEQQERDARMEALEARAAEADRVRGELAQTREALARQQGAIEQLSRSQFQQRETPAARAEPEESIDRRISRANKTANEALAKSDLDGYHEQMQTIMELKARQIFDAQPKPVVQQQVQQVQKPAWVLATEVQHADVMSHPQGQMVVGSIDALLNQMGEAWGPARLHKAMAEARTRLGIKPPAAAPQAGQRQLMTGLQSSGTGPRANPGERVVNVPKDYLATAARMGMNKAQAAKAWADSYPDES